MAVTLNASASSGFVTTADTSTILQLQTNGTTAVTVDASQNLGVGTTSPLTPLHVVGAIQSQRTGGANQYARMVNSGGTATFISDNQASGTYTGFQFQGLSTASGTPTTYATIDGNGNLGIGVTPSAWDVAYKAIDIQYGSIANTQSGSVDVAITQNAYYNGTNWITKYTGASKRYVLNDSGHLWFTGASATSGTAITFTERMRIDTSGRLLVGTTTTSITSSEKFEVNGNGAFLVSSTTIPAVYLQNSDATAATNQPYLYLNDGSSNRGALGIVNSTSQLWINGQAGIAFRYGGSGTGTTEAARIDSSGNLLVGTTSTNYAGSGMTLSTNSGTTKWLVGPTSGTPGNFWIASSGSTGVYLNGTAATSWSSNSDERLKTDLKPIENAAQKVASLRSVTGRYKTDEEGYSRAFLIAQDVMAVLPEAVAPTTLSDGTEVLGLAYTETIPLLVAAIKEQQALITSLTDRITALEGVK